MWTYNVSQLIASPTVTQQTANLMQVRLLTGDVLASDQQQQDEEINWQISQYSTIYGAAAACCRSLAAKYARMVDIVQGEMRTLYSARTKRYSDMARDLEMRGLRGAPPYAGGISVNDKTQVADDPDRVPPDFNRGQFDDLVLGGVGQQMPTPGEPDQENPEGWGS
jgi:hypothetical protein